MKPTLYLLLSLFALPSQASAADLPASLTEAAQADPRLAQIQTELAETRNAMEHGAASKMDVLKAQHRYLMDLFVGLPHLNLPHAERDSAQAQLQAALLENADAMLRLAQRVHASGLADEAELQEVRRECIVTSFFCSAKAKEDLKAELAELTSEAEAYWQRRLESASADKLQANRAIIKLLNTQRIFGRLSAETSARLFALRDENVRLLEQGFQAGQVEAEDVDREKDAVQEMRDEAARWQELNAK